MEQEYHRSIQSLGFAEEFETLGEIYFWIETV